MNYAIANERIHYVVDGGHVNNRRHPPLTSTQQHETTGKTQLPKQPGRVTTCWSDPGKIKYLNLNYFYGQTQLGKN